MAAPSREPLSDLEDALGADDESMGAKMVDETVMAVASSINKRVRDMLGASDAVGASNERKRNRANQAAARERVKQRLVLADVDRANVEQWQRRALAAEARADAAEARADDAEAEIRRMREVDAAELVDVPGAPGYSGDVNDGGGAMES